MYPGDRATREFESEIGGKVIRELIQSEEGGRFLRNESVLKIIETDRDFPIDSNQFWISAGGLKTILKTSCFAGYQLRCIASLILEMLYPNTFSGQGAVDNQPAARGTKLERPNRR